MFTSTKNKGFNLTFANGYTISVQFGESNYGDNRNNPQNPQLITKYKAETAEVAVWNESGDLVCIPGFSFEPTEKVLGWATPDQVADLIAKVKGI